MPFSEKGFTLIELLVVISIIALLSTVVITSVKSQRNKARDVSFQSMAKSVQKGAGICCAVGGGEIQNLNMNADLCVPSCGSVWPAVSDLGSVEIIRNCDSMEGYMLRLRPGTGNAGGISHADCNQDDCAYTYN